MPFICEHCHYEFTKKHHMTRHINERRCKVLKKEPPTTAPVQTSVNTTVETSVADDMRRLHQRFRDVENRKSPTDTNVIELVNELRTRLSDVEKRLIENEKKVPSQNVLQVVCVTNNDNYLDMLTHRMGNLEDAIEYIRDCALSDVDGDCRLIEKIYLDQIPCENGSNLAFGDKRRNKIFYYNDKNEQVSESRQSFAKRLANNLQNSYLKGINFLINRGLETKISPNKFLEDYDLVTWNAHIYQLSESKHQKKLMCGLSLPFKQDLLHGSPT
jgi:hypothetical protein